MQTPDTRANQEARGEDTRGKTVRLAVIGCGQIGRLHVERLVADGRATIVALCDPLAASAERLRDEFVPGARVFDDYAKLLTALGASGGELDAVVICTPTNQHFDQVVAARRLGLHVLCEKPLADSRARIVELINAASQGGPLLSLAYQRRYWATFRTLRREVQSGRWGAVRSVTTHSSERWQQTIAGTWRDDPQFNPGGFIGDAGSHKLDMVFFVTGLKPLEAFAHSDRRGSRVEIVTTISARLSGPRLSDQVALSMSFIGDAQHWREDFHVHCAEADLSLREGGLWVAQRNQVQKLDNLEPESNPNAAFLNCLTAGAANEAPASCALPVWDFTQAVLESARTHKLVALETEIEH